MVAALAPPEFVQAVVVDPMEMSDLMHQGDMDFISELRAVLAESKEVLAIEDDPVRCLPVSVSAAVEKRDALVEPEGLASILGPRLDEEDDVIQMCNHFVREGVQLVGHHLLELLRG